jgi:hypothetical protein
MGENAKDAPPSGRPHVWSFWGAILVAVIGTAGTVVVGIQKGHSEDKRQDLEARIQILEADRARYQSQIASLTSQLAAVQGGRGKLASGTAPKGNALPVAPPDPASSDLRVRSIEDYVFTLDACQRQGADLYCWVVVRNDGADRGLAITDASRLIADDGTPYEQSTRIFGSREDGFLPLFVIQLSTGVPARIGLRFKGLGAKVQHLALLELVAPSFRVAFRDVPVT